MKLLQVKKSSIEGYGVYLSEEVGKGERIAFIQGERKVFKSKNKSEASKIGTWYGVSKYTWIDPGRTLFSRINHSCNPNAAIIGQKTIVARRNIQAGEELTLDYSMTDADDNWSLEPCRCKHSRCRKVIRAIQHLPENVVKSHLPLIPTYFLNLYRRHNPSVNI